MFFPLVNLSFITRVSAKNSKGKDKNIFFHYTLKNHKKTMHCRVVKWVVESEGEKLKIFDEHQLLLHLDSQSQILLVPVFSLLLSHNSHFQPSVYSSNFMLITSKSLKMFSSPTSWKNKSYQSFQGSKLCKDRDNNWLVIYILSV